MLSRWLQHDHVRQWWVDEPTDPADVERRYGPSIDGADPTRVFVVLVDDRPVGIIQRYRLRDEPQWSRVLAVAADVDDAAGIDYLIGEPDALGRGYGSEAIRTCVANTYAEEPVTSVIVAVQQANRSSWRALERAGFTRVWTGRLESSDPSDAGPAYVYLHRRDVSPPPRRRAPR